MQMRKTGKLCKSKIPNSGVVLHLKKNSVLATAALKSDYNNIYCSSLLSRDTNQNRKGENAGWDRDWTLDLPHQMRV